MRRKFETRLVVAFVLSVSACAANAPSATAPPPAEPAPAAPPAPVPEAPRPSPTMPAQPPVSTDAAGPVGPRPPTALPDAGAPPSSASDAAAEVATAPPVADGDTPPARPLKVDTASPQLHTIRWKPSEADPATVRRDETQTAMFDTGAKPVRGKLVVALSGVGGGPGPNNVVAFTAQLGYHALSIAYENSVNPSGQNDPEFFGKMRFEQFDGTDRTPAITVARADCVEVRLAKSLAYLASKNPAGDWGYYLQPSGDGNGNGNGNGNSVRWSDVIFIGHSHGATSAAAFAKLRRVWRAISLAGPRDTRPVTAAWLTMPSATPIDRYYGFTAVGDGQHQDHIKAMEAMGYVGALVDIGGMSPPYGGSHRLKHAGGHGDSAACGRFAAACRYMLGAD